MPMIARAWRNLQVTAVCAWKNMQMIVRAWMNMPVIAVRAWLDMQVIVIRARKSMPMIV